MKGRYAEALTRYDAAKLAAEQAPDTAATAAALNGIANVHLARGAYDLALASARESLALRPEAERSPEAGAALLVAGHVHRLRSDYDTALDWFQRSLAIQEALGRPIELASALSAMGIVHRQQGRFEEAAAHYERALTLLRDTSDRLQTARTLNNLGVLHVARGDLDAALACYRESLRLHEAMGNVPNIASTLGNIGIIHARMGNNQLALEHYRRSLASSEKTGDRALVAEALKAIGVLYSDQGSLAAAMDHDRRALALYEALGNRAEAAMVETNIAVEHRDLGEYEAALALFEKALRTREAIGDRTGIADSWFAIGGLHERQSRDDTGLDRPGLERAGLERAGLERAGLERASDSYERSMKLYEAIGDQRGVAQALTSLQRVFRRRGEHRQALDAAERAVALSRTIGNRQLLWKGLLGVGQARHALGESAVARTALDEAIAVVESLRDDTAGGDTQRQRAFESKTAPYEALVALLVDEGHPVEALRTAERAKARVLLDVLAQGRVNVTKAMTTAEVREERDIGRELIALNAQIAYRSRGPGRDDALLAGLTERLRATQSRREAFRINLYAAHPELKVQRSDVPSLTAADAAALLNEGDAILEFVVTADVTYVFVIRRAAADAATSQAASSPGLDVKAAAVRIARGELASRTAHLRDQLAARDPGFRDASAALFDLLVAPASAHLRGARRLIIVPDAVLWELPFQALWQSDRGVYLLESHAISYAPSITVLREMTRVKGARAAVRTASRDANGSPRLLAFANPLLPAGSRSVANGTDGAAREAPLAPLPHAELEVRGLRQVYGPGGSRIHIGSAAREDRWKREARDFAVLHLATHGVLDATSPMYSYLALAPSPGSPPATPSLAAPSPAASSEDDGLLQAWELMALDLRADLVVLSACETARGRVAPGEGLIGLSWALFVAGSPAAIVSQWKVESASTAELMQQFHTRWRGSRAAPRLSKAEALQQAALATVTRRPLPSSLLLGRLRARGRRFLTRSPAPPSQSRQGHQP